MVAAKQQEEADRMSLALLSAKADAYAEEVYVREQNDPDYEGTINRFDGDWEKYRESVLKDAPERLRDKFSQVLEVKGLSYRPKFQGLFLSKQTDAIKAGYMATVDTLVKNKDLAGLNAQVPLMEKWSGQERQRVLQAGTKQIETAMKDEQKDALMGVLMDDPFAKVNFADKERFPLFDNGDVVQLKSFQRARQNEVRAEQARRRAEARAWTAEQIEEGMFGSASAGEYEKRLIKLGVDERKRRRLLRQFSAMQREDAADAVLDLAWDAQDGAIDAIVEQYGLKEDDRIKLHNLHGTVRDFYLQKAAMGSESLSELERYVDSLGLNPADRNKVMSFYGQQNQEYLKGQAQIRYSAAFNRVADEIQAGEYDGAGGTDSLYERFGEVGGFTKEDTNVLVKSLNARRPDPKDRPLRSSANSLINEYRKKIKDDESAGKFLRIATEWMDAQPMDLPYEKIAAGIRDIYKQEVVIGKGLFLGIPYSKSVPAYEARALLEELGPGWEIHPTVGFIYRSGGRVFTPQPGEDLTQYIGNPPK